MNSNSGLRVTYLGSHWNNGSNADTFYWNCNNDSSNANTNIGTHLCFKTCANVINLTRQMTKQMTQNQQCW